MALLYVEPPIDKLDWCRANGVPIEVDGDLLDERSYTLMCANKQFLPVCLVDNGFYYAATVGVSFDETKWLADPRDDRPKHWFMVDEKTLKANCPDWDIYIGDE